MVFCVPMLFGANLAWYLVIVVFTVAIIGPDGTGKSTVARKLIEVLPFPAKYLYMGVNLDAGNVMLPSTRLIRWLRMRSTRTARTRGLQGRASLRTEARNPIKVALKGIKFWLGLANRFAEEWYRQVLAWTYKRRGYIVVFDRHFYADYFASDIAGNARSKGIGARMHGIMLERFYPKPDLAILLDAPAELLFSRKAEGSEELLDRLRQDYVCVREHLKSTVCIDAGQPLEAVTGQAAEAIMKFHRDRRATPVSAENS